MKTILPIVVTLLLCSLNTFAQRDDINYYPNTRCIEINAGKARYGQYIGIGISVIKGNERFKIYYKVLGGHEFGKYKGFNRSTTFLELGAYSKIFKIGEFTYVNWFAGATTLLDYLGGFEGISKKAYLSYGPAVGIETETFITNKLLFLINFKQRLLFGGHYNTYYTIGLGLKYNL